jgi:ribonucleoside-triphosphate reductase
MLDGDASGRVFTFPIPTYNITKDFDWDNSDHDLIWEMTAKYGIPYFSNFINSDMSPEDARSMCCRLRLDQTELRKRGGGLFGSNPLTGSIGVVTINLPRIGFTSVDENDFFSKLSNLMELAKESLEIKRKSIEKFTEVGLYPYSKFYLRTVYQRFGKYWQNHFSTIGLLGMNEAILNFMPGENIATEKGRAFSIKVLDFMRSKLEEYQKETGNIYNLEATPGEGTTYRFARIDKKRFGRIIVANESALSKGAFPYYTNSTQLPVNYTDDIFEALELQDPLQSRYTGGTVFHTFVGEKLNKESVKLIVKKIAESFKLPYFTLTPTFSICPIHGYLNGEHEYCPKCDRELLDNGVINNGELNNGGDLNGGICGK